MNTEIPNDDPVAKVWSLYWKMKTDLQQLTVEDLDGGEVDSWKEIYEKAIGMIEAQMPTSPSGWTFWEGGLPRKASSLDRTRGMRD